MSVIYLASTSRWRASLLRNCGLHVQTISPQIEEKSIIGTSPVETAMLRAHAKGKSVLDQVSCDAIVISADQVVYIDGEIFGKPKDPKTWLTRLQKFQGRGHHLTTAVSLFVAGKEITFQEHSKVFFHENASAEELLNYIQDGEAQGCAGGYMVEQKGAWLIDRVEGDWLNVIGLPIFSILKQLRALGWSGSDCFVKGEQDGA